MMRADPITDDRTLTQAFAFLSAELIGGDLLPVVVTLQRSSLARAF